MAGELAPKLISIETVSFAANKAYPGKKTGGWPGETDPVIHQFADGLNKLIGDLAAARNPNYTQISVQDQRNLALTLLRAIIQGVNQEKTSVELSPADREGLGPITVDINPLSTDLTVVNSQPGQKSTFRMGKDRKILMAYFTGLTMAKLTRFQDPWITRREAAYYTGSKFTLRQFQNHLLDPLSSIGLMEKNMKTGYRMVCDPEDMIKALGSDRVNMSIVAKSIDKWRSQRSGTPLFRSHEVPVLKAIQQQVSTAAEVSGRLEINKLMETTGLSKDSILRLLRDLEQKGIIRRPVGQRVYRINDISNESLNQILSIIDSGIVIEVTESGKPVKEQGENENFGRTKRLAVARTEKITGFPEVSWRESGAEIDTAEHSRQDLLSLVDAVLTASLSTQTIIDDKLNTVYKGQLPMLTSVNKTTVLKVLEILGIGPRELERLLVYKQVTLAAAIRALEEAKQNTENQLLADEIKSSLATVLYESDFKHDEVTNLQFADLMEDLAGAAEAIGELKEETVVYVRTEGKQFIPDEELLDAMSDLFMKEYKSATSQNSFPIGFMKPVRAHNYHRKLSIEADKVPWDTLTKFRLARRSGADHHPEILPAGALVTALFLNENIRNKVGALSRGEEDGLSEIAKYVKILLERQLNSLSDSPEKVKEMRYIAICIWELEEANI